MYTQEWYNNKIASMDKVSIAQELEIDYNVAVVGRVYPDFPSEANKEVKYNPNLPLYVTIDNSHGGTDPNAVICIQDNGIYWDIRHSSSTRSTALCFWAREWPASTSASKVLPPPCQVAVL